MSDTPRVSIIVPVYNVEKYIKRCVDSLRNQTLADIDIVLVDDGSTDESPSMIDRYASEDVRIQVLHKANAGQGYARNDGLKLAKGEYVLFLDSDDYYEKSTCEDLCRLMDETGADMCTYGHEIDSPDGDVVRRPRILDDTYNDYDVRKRFVLHFFGDDPADDNLRGYSSCMSCFRMSVIREHGLEFPSEREVLSEDNLFCLEFCRYAQKVVTTSKIYYHYCLKADSFSQGYSAKRMPMTKVLLSHLRSYANEYGVSDKAQVRMAGLTWINMMSTIKQDVRRVGSSAGISSLDRTATIAGGGHADNECENTDVLDTKTATTETKVGKSEVMTDIRALCEDAEFSALLEHLNGTALPLQQKVFLWAYLHKQVNLLYFMARVRAGKRL